MSIATWPFLISSTEALENGVIVAPRFIIDSNISHLLDNATVGGATEPDRALRRTIRNANGEHFTLVFRIERARVDGQDLRDGFNRPIEWVIGFILKGLVTDISVTKEDFQKVYNSVVQDYRDFWDQTKRPPIRPSEELELQLDGRSGTPLEIVGDQPSVSPKSYDTLVTPPETTLPSRQEIPQITLEFADEVNLNDLYKVNPYKAVSEVVFNPKGDNFIAIDEKFGKRKYFEFYELSGDGKAKHIEGVPPLRSEGNFSVPSFSRDGKYLAFVVTKRSGLMSISTESEIWIGSYSRRENLGKILKVSRDILAVSFRPDGRYVVCGTDNGEIFLCDIRDIQEPTCSNHRVATAGQITGVTFSPDGRTVVSSSSDGKVRIWELSSSSSLRDGPLPLKHSKSVRSVAFSPDGKLLASGSDDATVKIWETSNYTEQFSLKHQGLPVRSVTFAPDGPVLVSSGREFVKFWNATDGQEIPVDTRVLGDLDRLTSHDLSPNGRFLLLGSKDGRVRIFKVSY